MTPFAEISIKHQSMKHIQNPQFKDHSLSALDPLKLLLYDFTAHTSLSVILPSSSIKYIVYTQQ